MTAPAPQPAPNTEAHTRVVASRIFVRGLRLEAQIGVYAREQGAAQPLVIDMELDVAISGAERLSDTLNYETLVEAARAVAAEGHIALVETFAERLAGRCLADFRVTRARVRVEKPNALAPDAQAAGVEITAVRAG